MARIARSVPWWVWLAAGLVLLVAIDRAPMVVGGLAGAVAVLAALIAVVRNRQPSIADWQQAERAAAVWLRSVGCRDVALTTAGADGGVDIVTRRWAVQVKHTQRPVGRPAVQQIVGAAIDLDRAPAVVSTSSFSGPAVSYATDHDIALIELALDGRARQVVGSTPIGSRRIRRLS